MRILYLCHRLPFPPDKGDRLRAFHHLRHLGRRHEVHLLTLTDPQCDAAGQAGALLEHCRSVECFPRHRLGAAWRCLLALVTGRPLTPAYFHSRALAGRLRDLARHESFDAVIAYCSSMAPHARLVRGPPRLIDLVDVDSVKWSQYAQLTPFPQRALYALESRRLRRLESRLHRDFERLFVTTRRELAALAEICPEAHGVVLRNGIDLASFSRRGETGAARPTLVFVGQMDYLPNVDGVVEFARHVLPPLRARFDDLELLVVGRSPTARVRALDRMPGVRVTGEVEDVRPYLARAWVFVAPLRIARGVQNKVLEAMAMGLPAVCSRRVASGLADGGFLPERHLLVADGDAGWVAAVSRLLADEHLRAQLAKAARRRLEARHSWDRAGDDLERELAAVAGADRQAGWSYKEIA